MRTFILFTVLIIGGMAQSQAQAQAPAASARTKAIPADLAHRLERHNQWQSRLDSALGFLEEIGLDGIKTFDKQDAVGVLRPYAEYETAGKLFFSSLTHFGSRQVKETLLREVPSGVEVVLYVQYPSSVAGTEQWAHSVAPQTAVRVVPITSGGEHFWSRDALPIPVWTGSEGAERLGMVDARYYHRFEPDQFVARGFSAPLLRHEYYFEGGNFVTDARGNCFIVNKGYATSIPEPVFRAKYGCSSLTRLPFVAGIGHADERVKILSDTVAVTDTLSYVAPLEKKGYTVRVLPKLTGVRTYVNSLLVNGTLFLPVFGLQSDYEAIRTYENEGLRVVPVNTRSLADGGKGSIHCITMTYPPAEFDPAP